MIDFVSEDGNLSYKKKIQFLNPKFFKAGMSKSLSFLQEIVLQYQPFLFTVLL